MEEIDNNIIKKILYKFMIIIRKNKYTHKLYLFLDDIGLRITISKIFNYINNNKLNNNPTKNILNSRYFFDKHQLEIKKIISFLSDNNSKKIFISMINFRGSFDRKFLPYNSYKKQYWFTKFFKYKNHEIMIDCGAYDGDSIRSFKKAMNENHISSYKIIAFEPDEENYKMLRNNYPNIICLKSGLGYKTTKKKFEMKNYVGSCYVNEKEIKKQTNNKIVYIDVNKLDDIEECKDATIIKMDIEGAEYEALLGAEKIIKRNKPKLAICIYHKDEDFIRIPLIIHEWVPDYKLFVMQHSNTIYETVLYATL